MTEENAFDGHSQTYPEFIKQNPEYRHHFQKQFNDIIDKKLKKKIIPYTGLEAIQKQLRRRDDLPRDSRHQEKKTLIVSLDDCLLKTSIFAADLPRIDGTFFHNNL